MLPIPNNSGPQWSRWAGCRTCKVLPQCLVVWICVNVLILMLWHNLLNLLCHLVFFSQIWITNNPQNFHGVRHNSFRLPQKWRCNHKRRFQQTVLESFVYLPLDNYHQTKQKVDEDRNWEFSWHGFPIVIWSFSVQPYSKNVLLNNKKDLTITLFQILRTSDGIQLSHKL